jgi:hypothetical protein
VVQRDPSRSLACTFLRYRKTKKSPPLFEPLNFSMTPRRDHRAPPGRLSSVANLFRQQTQLRESKFQFSRLFVSAAVLQAESTSVALVELPTPRAAWPPNPRKDEWHAPPVGTYGHGQRNALAWYASLFPNSASLSYQPPLCILHLPVLTSPQIDVD